jgi:hypothetical protein
MGAKQFSDALRVRHLKDYDKLQLSYLWKIAEARSLATWGTRNSVPSNRSMTEVSNWCYGGPPFALTVVHVS